MEGAMTEWKSDDGRVRLICGDCMDFMRGLPDKCFELAIVDPPYGIGETGERSNRPRKTDKWQCPKPKNIAIKDWDNSPPSDEYFEQLFRVSVNQIIWGGNYFKLPQSSCWIFWDKMNGDNDFADGELAWASFPLAVRKFSYLWNGFQKQKPEDRWHPTQKPIALYRWLLQKYAKEGDRILDTHGGSMSSVIACHEKGFAITCCELDPDYYAAGLARVQAAMRQQTLDLGV